MRAPTLAPGVNTRLTADCETPARCATSIDVTRPLGKAVSEHRRHPDERLFA
jgi:hypothetical protein